MIRYLLDTDHLSLQQRGVPQLLTRLKQIPPDEIAISVITVEEQFRGRLAQIRSADSNAVLLQAYRQLRQTLVQLGRFNVVDFDTQAQAAFDQLKPYKLDQISFACRAIVEYGILSGNHRGTETKRFHRENSSVQPPCLSVSVVKGILLPSTQLKTVLKIGTQDTRIAAIALSRGITLVTRNQHHFAQVASLVWEDWSR